MMRNSLLIFALAAVAYLSAQPIPFERYYGRPEPWTDEFAHRLEKWGDRHVVIATVERGEYARKDIVIYDFDPTTGDFTDSLTLYPIAEPEVLATATTPEGELFIATRTRFTDLIRIDQYGPDGTLEWQYALDRTADTRLDALTVTPDKTLLLSLHNPTFTEFVEVSSFYGERWSQVLPGSYTVTAAAHLADSGGWVIAGQQFLAAPFVAMLTADGALLWRTDLSQAEQSGTAWYYSYFSALRYHPGTGTIEGYGGTSAGERAVATLNLLGQRIDDRRWSVPAHGFDEKIAFLPDSLLLSGGSAGYSLVDFKGATPDLLGQGSGFAVHRDFLFGTDETFFQVSVDRRRPFDPQIRLRSVSATDGVAWERTHGQIGYNPAESLRAAAVEPGGQFFYLFGAAPSPTDPYALQVFKTDAAGNLVWEQFLDNPLGEVPQAWDLRWSADGNLLLLYGGLNDLYLAKYRPDGSPLWQRTLPREYLPVSEHFLLELADGSLLVNDIVQEAGVETVVLKRLSGTGTLLERWVVPGFERGRLRSMSRVENNQVLLGGEDGEIFWGGRLTKFDLATGSVSWTLALQPPDAYFASFTAALPLHDGNSYAVALTYLHDNSDRSGVQYLRIERDGAILDWHFFENRGMLYATNARLQVDEGNNVILSYNTSEQLPGGLTTVHALRLAKFSPGVNTIYSESTYVSPFGPIDVPAMHYLGNGYVLFAGTSSGPNSYSPDGYVSVKNTGEVTGIDDPAPVSGLLVSPNPTDGIFWLETTTPAATDRPLELIDAQGRIVRRLILPAGEGLRQPVDIGALPQGLYFLRYRNGSGQMAATRIVKS